MLGLSYTMLGYCMGIGFPSQNSLLIPSSMHYLTDFNAMQRDNYDLPLYKVNTCYDDFVRVSLIEAA